MSRVASFLSEADEKGRAGDKRAPRLPGQWLSTCRGTHPREVSVRCRKDRAEDFAPRETKLTEQTQISLNPEVAVSLKVGELQKQNQIPCIKEV